MKKLLIAVLVLVVAAVIVVAMQPKDYVVERSIHISAPAELVFAEVSDFRRWTAWSPWETLDPQMKRSYEGEPGTVGAVYRWAGNADAGEGSMTITEVKAPTSVTQRLEFKEPFSSVATTSHTLVPQGDGVKVTWRMAGENDFAGKAFGLFMDMDALIGADYERGLSRLKKLVEEKAAPTPESTPEPAAAPPAEDGDAGEP